MRTDPIAQRFAAIQEFELSEADSSSLEKTFADHLRAIAELERFAADSPWPDLPETPAREAS